MALCLLKIYLTMINNNARKRSLFIELVILHPPTNGALGLKPTC